MSNLFNFFNQSLNFSFDLVIASYILLFSVFFILFVFMLGYVFSRLRSSYYGYDNVEQSSYQRALKIIDSARKESIRIYKDSQNRAKKVLEEAYTLKTDTKEDFDKHLSTVTKKQLSEFEEFLQSEVSNFQKAVSKETTESVKVLGDVSKDVQKEVKEGLEDLKQTILNETIESQKAIDKKVEEEYAQIEKEINAYKVKKMQDIDFLIGDIITNIASEVFRRSFSIKDHQDIILDVLKSEKEKGSLKI